MPSQPRIKKSRFGVIWYFLTSGKAVTGCSWGLKFLFFLYLISPMDLDKFKFPSILPSALIVDPAFRILCLSDTSYGLWSTDKAVAFPPLASTHLESPAFAMYIQLSLMSTTLAVQPLLSSNSYEGYYPCEDNISCSIRIEWVGSGIRVLAPASNNALSMGDCCIGYSYPIWMSCFFPEGVIRISSIFKNASWSANS